MDPVQHPQRILEGRCALCSVAKAFGQAILQITRPAACVHMHKLFFAAEIA